MNANTILSIVIIFLMGILLFTLVDPFMYWMPSGAQMGALTIAAVLMCVWVAFVLREGNGDERELVHRMLAGRAAYLSGVAVLTLALLVQGFSHTIDPWIPLALATMIVAKIAARWHADRYR